MTTKNSHLDLSSFRARFEGAGGREYWRSLEEMQEDPAFDEFLQREFPREASLMKSGVDRRDFFRLMSASLAFAGLTACTPQPARKIVPYVRQPEEAVPGKPVFYATAMTHGGAATGLLVETHQGRPTKIEGNPQHPGSLGATDPYAQAAVLGLYDPDRSETVRNSGDIGTWSSFIAALAPVLLQQKPKQGAGLRVLTESIVSPTTADQMRRLLERFPMAVWHQYEPAGRDNAREGARLAFGSPANTIYAFDKAAVVLALDADFLNCGTGHLRYTRDFMTRRRVRSGSKAMNRLYVVESTPSGTGSIADHRKPVRPTLVSAYARALAAKLSGGGAAEAGVDDAWITAVAKDLSANRGASVVIAGDAQPREIHALVHQVNERLGNAGQTVRYTDPVEASPVDGHASLAQLVAEMDAGKVAALVILGGNPVLTAPADVPFVDALQKVPFRAHLSPYYDETSVNAHWHVPQTHFLEEWSDTRAFDGTASIVQPMIAPLYNGRSIHEVLGLMTDDPNTPYEIVRNYWRTRMQGDFEKSWREALHDGFIPATAAAPTSVSATGNPVTASPMQHAELDLVFRPDPSVYDGRFANNGWLQELPKPITKLTWDNAIYVSPATAAKLDLHNEQVVEVSSGGRSVRGPVWIVPGHADDTLTLFLGYGRTRAGRIGDNLGFDAYRIRALAMPFVATGARVTKTKDKVRLASTQLHQRLDQKGVEGRHILREGTIAGFAANEDFAHDPHATDRGPSLYPEHKYEGNAWGMVIDTSVCVGCNGCVIACQAENNIPIVGKKEVLNGREMHWLRIDHYYKGDAANPEEYNMPVPCMHCENAPCEPVCPVEATTHSAEGLNDMTYNRCVGTRYCANNCPYKVRRFNFYEYTDYETESLKLQRNPDVTVRTRGVMEKCTYCVQRINSARIEAERDGRPIRDGEVVTACQAACPAEAIVFGNINDKTSKVAQLKGEPMNYGLLAELNTQPRTSYLGTLRNPNPEIKGEKVNGAEESSAH